MSKRAAAMLFLCATALLALLVHTVSEANKPSAMMQMRLATAAIPANAPAVLDVEEASPEAEGEGEEAEAAAPSPDPEDVYISMHPVYGRCKSVVNLPSFSQYIQKWCGNIHELNDVAAPCKQAMWQASDYFGCCWETVMDGYQSLYPEAYSAWRMWQGTLSGKAGIVFDDDNCGDSVGEKGYNDLKEKVSSLEDTVSEQSYDIRYLESMLGWGYQPYDYYKQGKKGSQLTNKAQMKFQLPPYHPAAKEHLEAGRKMNEIHDVANRARSVWNDALNSAYNAQLSSHKAAIARIEAQKMQDESMRALNSGLWASSRARADPDHPRSSNLLSSVDPNDLAVRRLSSAGVNV